jgi:hypothetical protein
MGKGTSAKRKTDTIRNKGEPDKVSKGDPVPSSDAGRIEFAAPLRPRPRLLIVLSVVLALWVAFLLVLYFRTVYPHRHDAGNSIASPQSKLPGTER